MIYYKNKGSLSLSVICYRTAGYLKGTTMKKAICNYHLWWRALPVLGAIIWGAFCITNNLWYDEAYSASMVSRSWFDLIYITAVDDHSPFYYCILKLFYHLCGGGTHFWALKLFSVLFMMGYLFLGMFYVKKLFDERISVWFMFFSITMPIMAVQAGNVRMYTAALFFMTLAGLTAYDLFREPTRKKWMIFFGASVGTVYCHTFAMIQMVWIYLLFLGAIIVCKKHHLIKPFFKNGLAVSAVYFPWLIVTFLQMRLRIKYDSGARSAEAIPNIYTLMDYCKEWFSALETPIALVVFCGMGIVLFLGYYAVDWMRKTRNYVPGLGVIAIGLTALTGAVVSYYINPCFLGRYAFPGFGSLACFYAVGMGNITSRKLKCGVLVVVIGSFLMQYASELTLEYDPGLGIYEEFVEENVGEDDCIIGPVEHTIFMNVYHPELQYYLNGYKRYSLPFVNTEAFTQWEQLESRKGNIWYICFEGSDPSYYEERYTYEEVLRFDYMYYDFVIYKLTHK